MQLGQIYEMKALLMMMSSARRAARAAFGPRSNSLCLQSRYTERGGVPRLPKLPPEMGGPHATRTPPLPTALPEDGASLWMDSLHRLAVCRLLRVQPHDLQRDALTDLGVTSAPAGPK